MATSNIAKLFKAFPDLEEDAINAVYAGLQRVRIGIQGYRADVRGEPRWLERNVDVLVQLLQSGAFDEPEEVA
ncbi:hypothetical protein EDB85DRAFT_2029062, partial [Lactarius pseudohatsudake]